MAHLIRVKLKDGSVVGLDPIRAAAKVKDGDGVYADSEQLETAAADLSEMRKAVRPEPTPKQNKPKPKR